ncbi:uncharacterized protein LOC142229454 [Haematobia irritans]|uniref:uncharacterized protein LOC142229454 n=1 Tax=Haematobia irritans TaxID=7368 RepID=UPI003F4FCD35
MYIDLSKCRTCLGDGNGKKYQIYDFAENDSHLIISEMLDEIVPQIKVKVESRFSQMICQICVDKLLIGFKFQQLCIESNNTWLSDVICKEDGETIQMLDPLTGAESFKLKQETKDNENFECEINPEEIDVNLKSDDGEWGDNDDQRSVEGDLNQSADSDTDSSNEKLSVLKERKLRKSSKEQTSEKSPKKSRRNSVNTVFPCQECGKIFDRLYRLKRHGTVHVKKRAFPCDICKYSFAAEKTYRAHLKVHEKEGTEGANFHEFQCTDCPKSFEKRASLIQHSQTHSNKKSTKTKSGKFNKCKEDNMEFGETGKEEENVDDHFVGFNSEEPYEEKENKHNATNDDVVKHEVEISPQIYQEPLDDYDDNGDWHEDDEYDESENEDATSEKGSPQKPKHGHNTDFVDTGIGEIEKPNSRNRRNGSFPCAVCGKIFDRPYRLKRHSSVHSLERPHACEICKYRFATPNLLKIHMIQHENETGSNFSSQCRPDGFKCPDCPRRFEKQASLSAHRQIHTRNASEANYPCTICQRNFMSVRSLTEHITNKHPEAEKHKCDQCDKTFVLHAHLVEHLNRHKGNKNLVCLICEKEFGYTNTLKEHMRTHSGETPYLCPQCGKTFRSASNLRQHMERHFGLKKYQCTECPSRFNCRSDLIKHMSTHTNSKPHVCDICGSRFTRSYSLQKHKLLHSGERPFKCDQCNMTFAIVYHLRRHTRTHTGEKPYKCKFCDRAYAESGDLTKHLRTHVGENTYMCIECPMAFKYQSELRQHVSEHYKMSKQSKNNTEDGHHMSGDPHQHNEMNDSEKSMLQHQQLPHHDNHESQPSTLGMRSTNQLAPATETSIANSFQSLPVNQTMNLAEGC